MGDRTQVGVRFHPYAIVETSGGVIQNEDATKGVLLVTIDWDEIDETEEDVALDYAVRVLTSIVELPDEPRKNIENTVHTSLSRRGYPTPDERDMDEPALCVERLDGCHVIFDEARGDGYDGACPACADKVED